MENITVFGEVDDKSIDQLRNCLEDGAIGVMTADGHYGYSHPIGGCVAYRDKISVSGVGFDIGCGNKAVRTDVMVGDLGDGVKTVVEYLRNENK